MDTDGTDISDSKYNNSAFGISNNQFPIYHAPYTESLYPAICNALDNSYNTWIYNKK